ncbi:MAG: hypothetical protein P1U81_07175 [Verrucomicrobiales bacterium]|nr:hypothetical protein [bacterium]MDF2376006.1 hypothetical protein [Verrucomicrobiales bacterium]
MNRIFMRRKGMTVRLIPVFLFALISPLLAEEQAVDPSEFNQRIREATVAGEEWTKDPSLIAATLAGPWIVPGGEWMSQRREVSGSTAGEDPQSGITVVVKEDGLFDDATRRIDHRYVFALVDGVWTVTDASVKYHDARPPFPLREEENVSKAIAGRLLLQQNASPALAEAAAAHGIQDLADTTFGALEGDPDSLNALLNLSLTIKEEARADYARLLYGLSCFFEKPGFTRYLFFHLEEGASSAVLELIRQVEEGEI